MHNIRRPIRSLRIKKDNDDDFSYLVIRETSTIRHIYSACWMEKSDRAKRHRDLTSSSATFVLLGRIQALVGYIRMNSAYYLENFLPVLEIKNIHDDFSCLVRYIHNMVSSDRLPRFVFRRYIPYVEGKSQIGWRDILTSPRVRRDSSCLVRYRPPGNGIFG